MTNRNDDKKTALLSLTGQTDGHIDDLEKIWLAGLGATSSNVNNAYMEMFLANGATSTNYMSAAREFLEALGYSGSIPTMWSAFWSDGGVIGPYDPGMMTFDGSTGVYSNTSYNQSGNKRTIMFTFYKSAPSSNATEYLVQTWNPNFSPRILSRGTPTGAESGKLRFAVQNTSGAVVCDLLLDTVVADGNEHFIFFAYDGDAGTAILYLDGVDADDTGFASRVLTTGTLNAQSTADLYIGGADTTPAATMFEGSIGFFGFSNVYRTNPLDFMDGSSPKEIDTSTWTEWGGTQPQFFQESADMSVENLGSTPVMTKNGTITGPA
jgi:hypothetical protein